MEDLAKKKRAKKLDLSNLPEEPLKNASPERVACQACKLFSRCKAPFMRPFVPKGWTRKLLLVGEAAGKDEDERSGRPFTGDAGILLRRLWRAAGVQDVDVAVVNAVRCRPVGNATPTMSQVRACRPFLLRTISTLKPRFVVGLGGTALRALTNGAASNVTRARGRQLSVPGLSGNVALSPGVAEAAGELPETPGSTPVSPLSGSVLPRVSVTYHPAAILHGSTALAAEIENDLRRLAEPLVGHPPSASVPPARVLAVDTEYAPAGRLLTVGLSDGRVASATEEDFVDTVGRAISEATVLVGHSAAGEVEKLLENSLSCRETWARGDNVLDSLLLARMVNENGPPGAYELEPLLLSRVKTEPWKYLTVAISKTDATLWPPELRRERCRIDAWASYLVARDCHKILTNRKTPPALIQFTHRLASSLSRLTLAGAFVDAQALERIGQELQRACWLTGDRLNKVALSYGMIDFSPTNDTDLRDLLYTHRGLPVSTKTKIEKLPSVDKPTLTLLDDDVARLLLEYNTNDKLYRTNIVGLAQHLRAAGAVAGQPVHYLPFHINPLAARTGRRASSNPNSQNWSKRIRGIIRSRWPNGAIGDFDYSKLEPVLLAWYAKDRTLYHAFTEGGGYKFFAKELWGFDCGDDSPEYRATKSIILGVHYNMQTPKMAKQLWLLGVRFSADYAEHERKTDRLRAKYLSLVPGVVRYMERQEQALSRDGYVVAADGAIRHLPLTDGQETPGYGHILNQAINFPIQRLASTVTGSALLDIEAALLGLHSLDYRGFTELLIDARRKVLTTGIEDGIMYPMSMIFNEVHDDLVVDLHPDYRKRDEELIIETMRTVPTLRKLVPTLKIPFKVGAKVGSHWGEAS